MKKYFPFLLLYLSVNVFGQFGDPNYINCPWQSVDDVSYADMDNDGMTDLLFLDNNSETITWVKNIDANGTWSTMQLIDYKNRKPVQVLPGDINGDGFMDIIAVFSNSNFNPTFDFQVIWYENLENGKFSEGMLIGGDYYTVSTVTNPSFDVGDIDNDGDIDVVAAIDLNDKIVWFKNEDGQGSFGPLIEIDTDFEKPLDIRLAHLNNDNFLDVVVQSNEASVSYYENFNGLAFADGVVIASPSVDITRMDIADLDGDMDNDLVLGSSAFEKIIWFENLNNDGIFSVGNVIADEIYSAADVDISDIDNDGDNDVLYLAGFGGEVGFIENTNGAGLFGPPTLISEILNFSYDSRLLAFDTDNDGDQDLIATDGEISFIENNGSLNFEVSQRLYLSPEELTYIDYGDLTGDGINDIIVESDKQMTWQKYNSEFDLYEAPIILGSFTELNEVKINDINDDGHNDITFVGRTSSTDYIFGWYINDGQGNFSSLNSIPVEGGFTFDIEDMDNDGLEDLVVRKLFPSRIDYFKKLSNDPTFASGIVAYGAAVRQVELVDVDADGLKDIVLIENNNNNTSWLKNNGGSFGNKVTLFSTLPNNPEEFVYMDYDGDTYPDFIVATTNSIKYFTTDGPENYEETQSLASGFDLEKLLVMDYDLDGHMDLLFTHYDGDSIIWKKYLPFDQQFGTAAEVIDLGLEGYGFLNAKDMDNDGDLDLIYGNYRVNQYVKSVFSNPKVTAKAYYDANENNVYDPNETLLNGIQFGLLPNSLYHLSNPFGEATFFVDEGDYTLLPGAPLPGWSLSTTPASFDIEADGSFDLIEKHFGFFPDSVYTNLNLDLTSATTRCGFTVPFWLTTSNDGTLIETGLLELKVLQHATYLSAEPAPDSIAGNSYYWNIENQGPTHKSKIDLMFEVAGVEFLGDSVLMDVNFYKELQAGVYELSGNYDFASEINCAYDPNDKKVDPPGVQDENYTLFGEELFYTIRFQNTGTDTAFNISIVDDLDQNLDWNTFRVVSYSHYQETSIDPENGRVIFSFPDILLPDSIVNEPLSHGFVKYRIKAKNGLDENTVINNTADIFFDFNDPIQTNTTTNTLVSQIPVIDAVVEPEVLAGYIYPNPFSEYFTIEFSDNLKIENIEIRLSNALGQRIGVDTQLNARHLRVHPQTIQSGVYSCEIIYQGGSQSFLIVKQ